MMHRLVFICAAVAVPLVSVGCATKQFVREEVGKSEAAVRQEVGRIDSDLGQEKSRIGSLATQVTETRSAADGATRQAEQASTLAGRAVSKADEAGGRAGQALAKADEASATASQALGKAGETDHRLTRLWNSRNKLQSGDTTLILFGFDKWQLDDRAETALLDVIKVLEADRNLMVQIEGYTDSVGPTPYNVQLSQRRAEAVRRFLVAKGIQLHRIQWIGLGDARPAADNATRQGREQNRRVAVTLMAPAAD
jgi:outer membrane protein OmpA-like peptidoglycan-associated protein